MDLNSPRLDSRRRLYFAATIFMMLVVIWDLVVGPGLKGPALTVALVIVFLVNGIFQATWAYAATRTSYFATISYILMSVLSFALAANRAFGPFF